MTPLAITGAIFAVMLLLMALRTPIAIAMFVAGSLGYVVQAGWPPFANFLNAWTRGDGLRDVIQE